MVYVIVSPPPQSYCLRHSWHDEAPPQALSLMTMSLAIVSLWATSSHALSPSQAPCSMSKLPSVLLPANAVACTLQQANFPWHALSPTEMSATVGDAVSSCLLRLPRATHALLPSQAPLLILTLPKILRPRLQQLNDPWHAFGPITQYPILTSGCGMLLNPPSEPQASSPTQLSMMMVSGTILPHRAPSMQEFSLTVITPGGKVSQ
mmetsp:Transcript_3083/g.8372  ORF Transcript_3083/g.8372 Transcript_3083/m.8372 type:complete len:206 (-) Transcript_3083:579-1196(-)